jgi:hypothetical protein
MFTVTSVHLSSDTTVVDPTLGHANLGSLSEEEFIALLYRFRALSECAESGAGDQGAAR